jgi:NAD(P)-dependent dehydrogenase (short-subunit alcohol dehydrogenase family)
MAAAAAGLRHRPAGASEPGGATTGGSSGEQRERRRERLGRPSAVQRAASWCCWTTALGVVLFVVLCMALVGGPRELYECCEPMWQPELVEPEPGALALEGRTALVTGANRGYGLGAARHLAEQGARVVMACRTLNPAAADSLTAGLLRDFGPDHPGSVEMVHVDLTDLPSVAALATSADIPALDIVVLNAAVVDDRSAPYKLKAPGGATLNRMYAVNYLANVVLVQELIRSGKLALRDSPAHRPEQATDSHEWLQYRSPMPRLVVISSGSYAQGGTEWFGADGTHDWVVMSAMRNYGQTKFLQAVWALDLQHAMGGRLDVVLHNPGPVHTELGSEHVPPILGPVYRAMKWLLFVEPYEAAAPLRWLVSSQAPPATYLHIRERTMHHNMAGNVLDESVRAWVRTRTNETLKDAGLVALEPERLARGGGDNRRR